LASPALSRPRTDGASNAFNRKAQQNQKKNAVLMEAARIFNERGYAMASLEDVAVNLNISKAAVYYYFRNKQEILYECYQVSFDVWEAALAEGRTHGRTGRDKVEVFVRRHLEAGLDALQPLLMIRDQEGLEPEHRSRIEKRRRVLRNRLREFISEGIADGSISPCDPKPAATIIGASITWLLRMYRPDGDLPRSAFIDQVLALLLHGLAGQSSK
jgi:TetR/AcrR family transcriptional regulator